MIRKIFFWMHLSVGITAGLFIFVMAATGVALSFERQMIAFVDRDISSVPISSDAQQRPATDLLNAVRRAGIGSPTAIVFSRGLASAMQVQIGRGKTVHVDPYSGAILGASSPAAHTFFFTVERLHRTLGAPLGSKGIGHWLVATSNILFGVLILLGAYLWLPRKWNWKTLRVSLAFRSGIKGKARDWNWHNVIGIWCALPLLLIVLTGVVMSFDWANKLLFQLTNSTAPAPRREGGDFHWSQRRLQASEEPNYDDLFSVAKSLNPGWRTITINVANNLSEPISATVDTGTGGQPQKRTQYLLNGRTGVVMRMTSFSDGSPGQRLRAFVRFGHTGEYGGVFGQVIAAVSSLGGCVLVYTGLALAVRRLMAILRRKRVPGVIMVEEKTYV